MLQTHLVEFEYDAAYEYAWMLRSVVGPRMVIMVGSWLITLYTLWQLCSMHEVNGKRFNRYHELGQVQHTPHTQANMPNAKFFVVLTFICSI